MERRTGIIIAVTIGIILIGVGVMGFLAWRTSNEILEEFERVNHGLDSTRLTIRDSQSRNQNDLDLFVCAEMVAKADSLRLARTELIARMDMFKLSLVRVARFSTTAADSVFDAEEQGTHLYNELRDFFDLAERTCTNDSIDMHIDQYAQVVREKATMQEWRAANFQHVPAIACITLLSKFQSDAVNAEVLAMNDLLARCSSNPAKP